MKAKKLKNKENYVMPYSWAFELDTVPSWATVPNLFSADECEKIIKLGLKLNPDKATVGSQKGNVDYKVRESLTSWIGPMDEAKWIFERITRMIIDVNNQHFKFNLFGMVEGFQFTKYVAPKGHYTAHIDKMYKGSVRKLSLTVQLTNPKEYKGGELQIYEGANPQHMPKELGMGVIFPSYVLHRVSPVTKGTRYSLVAWFTGDNFK